MPSDLATHKISTLELPPAFDCVAFRVDVNQMRGSGPNFTRAEIPSLNSAKFGLFQYVGESFRDRLTTERPAFKSSAWIARNTLCLDCKIDVY